MKDFGTTLFLSLHKLSEMKTTDASVQFANTAFLFQGIALYLRKFFHSGVFFFLTLNSVVRGRKTSIFETDMGDLYLQISRLVFLFLNLESIKELCSLS